MEAQRVLDVMTTEVISVRKDASFKEVVRLMHDHAISGVPVVDEGGHLVGIVTEADLLFLEEEPQAPQRSGRSFLTWFIHPAKLAEIERRAEDVRVEDIMTRSVVTTRPEIGVREAIKVLLDAGVKRLPVVAADGKVVGIVSRRDLLMPFLRPDDEVAREISKDVIFETMWIDPATITVEVREGVVTLRGRLTSRSTKGILVELVRRVDGVVGVEDHLSYDWDDRNPRLQEPFGAPRRGENWSRIEG